MKSIPKFWKSLPKSVKAWAYYDFANSSYVLIYQSYLLPVLFSNLMVLKSISLGAWGLANGLSTVIGVVISIFLGHYADVRSRFSTFKYSIFGSFVGMVVLSITIGFFPECVFYVYVLTNSVFILSLSLSDSILPYLADQQNAFEYSGFAWGYGYIGGVASMIIVVLLQRLFGEYSWLAFMSVAIFYMVFSLYALKGLKGVRLNESREQSPRTKKISRSQKAILLFGYWLMSECITVVILFYSIYAARELDLSTLVIGLTLLCVQILGFPATWIGGRLAERHDHLLLLGLTIVLWGIIIGLLVTNLGTPGLVLIVLLTSLVIGNSQSLLRAQYSRIIERSQSGFQFGLYSMIAEASVLVGPVLYGIASDRLHSQKIPLFTLFLLMMVGYGLVSVIIRKLPGNAVTISAA
jgi:MFS transporter, UMF1 family